MSPAPAVGSGQCVSIGGTAPVHPLPGGFPEIAMAPPAALRLAVVVVVLALAQAQQQGRSLVDWYFFDVGDAPVGKLVSVPLTSHHTNRRTKVTASLKTDADAIEYPDSGCFIASLGATGVCAPLAACPWAQHQMAHWRSVDVCPADSSLVCCPASEESTLQYPSSPVWDPYTFQYYPGPDCHHDRHHQQHQQQQQGGRLPPRIGVPSMQSGARPQQPTNTAMKPAQPQWPAQPQRPMQPSMQRPKQPQQPMQPQRPMEQPQSNLVPLIDEERPEMSFAQDRKPGDIAKQKCVEYERWAPTVRYGPDKDCVPNHSYPVGGNPAVPHEFPHMAQLGVGRRNTIQWFCGGSLIAPTWVLTAAHCLYSEDRRVQWVRLGDQEPDSDDDDSNPQVIAVKEVVRHPDYKVRQVYNDIALIRLAREPDMTPPHVRPACLQVDRELKKDKLNLIGFGLTEENGDPAPVLMEVALWRTPYEKCRTFFDGEVNLRQLPRGLDDDSQLCAGLNQAGEDACQGDSGGPLNTPYSPSCMLYVAGVVSFGQGCGRGSPGVYTRVSHFVPWIESIVWPDA